MQGLSRPMVSSERFRGRLKAIWCLYAFTNVHFTQPSHYRTDEVAYRCRIFPTASPIIKIFSSRPVPFLVLFEYSSRYGTTCVPGAKTDDKLAHKPGTQSMGDNDIHYRANCAWVQHYPVTLNKALCSPKSTNEKPRYVRITVLKLHMRTLV